MTTFDNIKKYAKARGMNLQEVAKQSGLSANMIYQYKKMNPKIDTLNKIASTLHVSVNDLLGKEDKKTADEKDLQEFLKDNMEHGMTYADHELTDEEKERLKIAMTQIFWKYHDKY